MKNFNLKEFFFLQLLSNTDPDMRTNFITL